jgi:cell division protease FtsH
VAKLLPKTDPVHKVTIIPRGRALGVTMQLPEQDRYSQDRNRLLDTITVLFGGRIAEEIFMHQMTTGASNDFERATEIARRMVTQWGMSDELGTMVYGENEGEVFLGRSITTHKNVSEATLQKVDSEIRRIIDTQYKLARKLIEENREKVEAMAKATATPAARHPCKNPRMFFPRCSISVPCRRKSHSVARRGATQLFDMRLLVTDA